MKAWLFAMSYCKYWLILTILKVELNNYQLKTKPRPDALRPEVRTTARPTETAHRACKGT